MQQPTDQPELSPSVRTLKIEADGDLWKGRIKPKIRLIGRWLERAGFRPGHRVQVKCVAPGVLELRSPDGMKPTQPEQSSSESLKRLGPLALFRVGRIEAAPDVHARISAEEITRAVSRHQAGDWGDVDQEQCQANCLALKQSGRLISLYRLNEAVTLQLATEGDRSRTTVLLTGRY